MKFADLHALKILPEKIAAAELEIARLEESLSDRGFLPAIPSASPTCRQSGRHCAPRRTPTRNAGWRWKWSARRWSELTKIPERPAVPRVTA